MSEMVELVARAIVKSRGLDPDRVSAEDGVTPIWKYHEGNARAAIEAMREPTERMLEMGDHGTSAAGWGYMIDEALE